VITLRAASLRFEANEDRTLLQRNHQVKPDRV